jgi:hypothetical protein
MMIHCSLSIRADPYCANHPLTNQPLFLCPLSPLSLVSFVKKAEELGKPREKVDVAGMVMAVVPALDQAVEADDNETARVCISALQAMQDEVTGLPDVVRPLVIEAGCAEQALRALASAASDDEGAEGVGAAAAAAAAASKTSSELSVAALSFLSGVASSEDGLAKLQEHDAFGVVVEVRIEEFLTSSCSSIPLC